MTVLRAPRDALRGMFAASVLAALAVIAVIAVVVMIGIVGPVGPVGTVAAATSGPTTTVQVASGAPVPAPVVAVAPQVGPLDAGVGGAPGRGVWWLFGLGGLQVAGLFLMTRRTRARLSVPDPAS